MTQKVTPALFIALLNVISFAVLIGFHLATQTPIYFISKWIMPGIDYRDFYQASAHVLNGDSPYLVARYVTPPLFAFANAPLLLLGFEVAHLVFISIIPFTILYSFLIIHRALGNSNEQDDWFRFIGIIVILFSYPFYFLFERGNIDGVVLFCMCLSLYLMDKRSGLSGLLLAIAIHFKLYPLLLLPPLFIFRQWKTLLWTCGWALLLVLLTTPYWDDYLASSYHRSYYFRLDENGSLVNTIMVIIVFIRLAIFGDIGSTFDENSSIYAAVLYALSVVMMFYADYKLSSQATQKEKLANMLLYFPFMVAIPQLVYHYEFIVLIPLLSVLNFMWKDTLSRQKKYCLVIIALGISLSQWQAIALHILTNNMLAYYVPGFGLLLVMIGISIYKWIQLRDMLKPGVSGSLFEEESVSNL